MLQRQWAVWEGKRTDIKEPSCSRWRWILIDLFLFDWYVAFTSLQTRCDEVQVDSDGKEDESVDDRRRGVQHCLSIVFSCSCWLFLDFRSSSSWLLWPSIRTGIELVALASINGGVLVILAIPLVWSCLSSFGNMISRIGRCTVVPGLIPRELLLKLKRSRLMSRHVLIWVWWLAATSPVGWRRWRHRLKYRNENLSQAKRNCWINDVGY